MRFKQIRSTNGSELRRRPHDERVLTRAATWDGADEARRHKQRLIFSAIIALSAAALEVASMAANPVHASRRQTLSRLDKLEALAAPNVKTEHANSFGFGCYVSTAPRNNDKPRRCRLAHTDLSRGVQA